MLIPVSLQPAKQTFERLWKTNALSFNAFKHRAVEVCTKKTLAWSKPLFYVSIALSVAAAVAVFFSQTALAVIFIVSSCLLFALSVWSIRKIEKKVTEELGSENSRLLQAVQTGEETLLHERENLTDLTSKNEKLASINKNQGTEILNLQQTNKENNENITTLTKTNEKLKNEAKEIDQLKTQVNQLEKNLNVHTDNHWR